MANASEEHYRGETGQRYQQEKRGIPEKAIPWVAKLRAEKFQPFIKPTDVVVELGVGQGWNLAHLRCAKRIGTDLEDFLPADLKADRVEFVRDSASIRDETADAVICHHVLEHLENPPDMLREAKRILKHGGYLLLYVPFEKERRYRRFDPNEPNHHLYSWNVQTLSNLISSQGFLIKKTFLGEFGFDRFASKLALRFGLGETGFHLIRRLTHFLQPGREVRLIARKQDPVA
jgi:SAM-dependent methyltransferase